jgi:hypothetical protein
MFYHFLHYSLRQRNIAKDVYPPLWHTYLAKDLVSTVPDIYHWR